MEGCSTFTITNNTTSSQGLSWMDGITGISAHGSVTVDYEPWSRCSQAQRTWLADLLNAGALEFELHVRGKDGKRYDIKYNPADGDVSVLKSVAVVPPVAPANYDEHVVIAGTSNMDAMNMGFKAENVQPPSGRYENRLPAGFRANMPGGPGKDIGDIFRPSEQRHATFHKEGAVTVVDNEPDTTYMSVDAEKAEKAAEAFFKPGVREDEPPARIGPSDEAAEKEFDRLLAEHAWTAALDVLRRRWGKKVTVKARALRSVKNYDDAVKKFNLKD